MPNTRVLLFDLGGVLVESAGLSELPGLLPRPMAAADLRHKWITSPAVIQFESGGCSSDAFAAAFIAEWGLSVAPEAFLAAFAGWVRRPYPGVPELLSALRSRYMLACLSNTNAVHWAEIVRMDGMSGAFDRRFLSYDLGVMKPSLALYRRVVADLGCEPGEVVFFDDGPENIAGAAGAGLVAHLTVGPEHLRAVLTGQGLL